MTLSFPLFLQPLLQLSKLLAYFLRCTSFLTD